MNNPEMKVIRESEWSADDGTFYKLTISTEDGGEISLKDLAFIGRVLPLAAGLVLEKIGVE